MSILLFLITPLPYLLIAGQLEGFFQDWKKKQFWKDWFYLLFLLIIFAVVTNRFATFATFFFFLFLYHRRLKKTWQISFFYGSYILLTYHIIRYFISSFILYFYRLSDSAETVWLIFDYVGMAILVFYIHRWLLAIFKIDFALLEEKAMSEVLRIVNSVFAALLFVRLLNLTLSFFLSEAKRPFDTTISLAMLVGYVASLVYLKTQEEKHRIHQDLLIKEGQIRDLNQFINKLGNLYDEIRGIRHDLGGVVASMRPAIAEGDLAHIEKIYEEALIKLNVQLQKADYHSFDVKNIEDLALRSVLANKALQAEREQITFDIEAHDWIPVVAIPMLEVIRMGEIILNNALEAAKKTIVPTVRVALFMEDKQVVFIVSNNRLPEMLDQSKIWQRAYSTKEIGRGHGLANLLDLVHQYDGLVSLQTNITQESFTQILKFKQKGDFS
ncbi:MAG: GHKL domain-containing protein [Candidatus Saccharibacteria bacterium]|nr:GHKL domain-containing protein [Candidatus Saccharibacteria bacterium]